MDSGTRMAPRDTTAMLRPPRSRTEQASRRVGRRLWLGVVRCASRALARRWKTSMMMAMAPTPSGKTMASMPMPHRQPMRPEVMIESTLAEHH